MTEQPQLPPLTEWYSPNARTWLLGDSHDQPIAFQISDGFWDIRIEPRDIPGYTWRVFFYRDLNAGLADMNSLDVRYTIGGEATFADEAFQEVTKVCQCIFKRESAL